MFNKYELFILIIIVLGVQRFVKWIEILAILSLFSQILLI